MDFQSLKSIEEPFTNSAFFDVTRCFLPLKRFRNLKIPDDFWLALSNYRDILEEFFKENYYYLRMYGSAREFAESLRSYQNFPLSHNPFFSRKIEPYYNAPTFYKSLKGEEFIQKSDVYALLYRILSKTLDFPQFQSHFKTPFDTYFICSILSDVIKYHEHRLFGTCEFVKYDEGLFIWIAEKYARLMDTEIKQYESKSPRMEKFRNDIKSINCQTGSHLFEMLFDNLTQDISIEIDWLFEEKVLKQDIPEYQEWLFRMFSLLNNPSLFLPEIMNSYPSVFLPLDSRNPNGGPVVVRVFEEERNEKFVMKSELFHAFSILYPRQQKPEPEIDVVTTIRYVDVLKKYKDRISKIEFIRVPIQRSKHAAVPIMTNFGDCCIPAADALFELLNRLIFCEQIFQKFKIEQWPLLKTSLSSLEQFFAPYHRSIYFITIIGTRKAEKLVMDQLEKSEKSDKMIVNNVRNAKKDGFTMQNLKNELANLGVTELFPEIQEYAEAVYSEVLDTKKEEFLRTCDLFDAVEMCLLICILKRFPNLQLFLHTQSACHRLPSLFCEYCTKTAKSGKFKNTTHCQLTLPNGSILCNNFKFFSAEEIKDNKMTYFIMDCKDSNKKVQQKKKNKKKGETTSEHLHSLSKFLNNFPDKKIYIRAIPTTSSLEYSDETRRLFAEEALEIIQILLKSRNSSISDNNEKIKNYKEKFKRKTRDTPTLNLAEFWFMLEEFDVDKTRITIVPDPIHELSLLKLTENLRNDTLNVIGPNGDMIMRKEQVVLHLFQIMVSEVDWNRKECQKSPNCWHLRRAMLIRIMRKFAESPDGDYVLLEIATFGVQLLKTEPYSKEHAMESTPLSRLENSNFDDMIPAEMFISGCKEFGLDDFLERSPKFLEFIQEEQSAPAWVCRVRFFYAFAFYLFHMDTYDLQDMVWKEVLLRQPICDKHRGTELEFSCQMLGTKSEEEEEENNESKCCSKCLRTSEMCNEAKKELKMTQNRLEKYEKKARRTEEVESQIREMEVEMKRMKKEMKEREVEVDNKNKENEDLKRKMLKLEAKDAKMQLAEKNHSISQNGLLEKITHLSDQLKFEKERNDVLQSEKIDELTAQLESQKEIVELMKLELQQNEERLNSEIREKQRGFEELRAALRIMSNENESIQRDNRNLRERIASVPEAPPTPTLPESLPDGPTHHRFALLGFQKIKDSLYNKKQLKQAKEMIEKLKSSSNLVEIHQIADYEYYQFEWNLLKYTKEVELNIQRIKETCDVSTVTPLPDIPEFSKRFVNLYWRIINNQPISSSEIEVSDSECFICTEEMTTDQKTLECEECKKVTHLKCASQWLKIHRSCPHCRREMLNPEEFPNLGQ
ncbi:hypothetical protein B9Z55_009062 [Caenorhabditis nigoni]|uniref:RING-type domain-containing protein n=1 Tax=Caenorhabditis nigoni TaxID=1611254 RepID=A0A2G5UQC9_9PELO|nr:hypothetical protein B9Z55_009062 [Caenorhabditis nigoni]